ncbi:hypothetical protein RIF29_29506 [Crotalaria pallida]|uniref:Reverse transcriptase zinc-binding domain-containing protein n=1 Tax=Crotalaria pallida TaxID=3830 RepID=A0AAN9HVZ1_CROPI
MYTQIQPACEFCSNALETRDHLFFACQWSRTVLEAVCDWCCLDNWHYRFDNWCRWLKFSFQDKGRRQFIYAAMAATTYHIWMERNRRIFRHASLRPDQVFVLIKRELALRISLYVPNFVNWSNRVMVHRILTAI